MMDASTVLTAASFAALGWAQLAVTWAIAVLFSWGVASTRRTTRWRLAGRALGLTLGQDTAGPTLTGTYQGRAVAIRVERGALLDRTTLSMRPSDPLPPGTQVDQHSVVSCRLPGLRRVAVALLTWAPLGCICAERGVQITLPGFRPDAAELVQWMDALVFFDRQLSSGADALARLESASADPATRSHALAPLTRSPQPLLVRVDRCVETPVSAGSALQGGRSLLGWVGPTRVVVRLPAEANDTLDGLLVGALVPFNGLYTHWDTDLERPAFVHVVSGRDARHAA